MSEYGSGLTFGQCCMMDKERIKHALRGQMMCGETEEGFEYCTASKEQCEEYILSAYDNAVYHALQAMTSARAHERLHGENKPSLKEYMDAFEEENRRFNDYKYECDDVNGLEEE